MAIILATNSRDTRIGSNANGLIVVMDDDDLVFARGGHDVVPGGAGNDTAVFNAPSQGVDTIADFVSGADKLEISASGFGAGLVAGGSAVLTMAASIGDASAPNANG